jgi:uncharacterized repeat protein (TIGR01451 family)
VDCWQPDLPDPDAPLADDGSSQPVGSFDPNDKLAPAGYGDAHFVTGDTLLPYQIRFENKSDATAPAQKIVVTDTLDEDLDLNTFELTAIAFAEHTILIPPGLNHYEATVPINPEGHDLLVQIDAALDFDTRELTLTMLAVDPATGWLPQDVISSSTPSTPPLPKAASCPCPQQRVRRRSRSNGPAKMSPVARASPTTTSASP